jgi:hypothetical protein
VKECTEITRRPDCRIARDCGSVGGKHFAARPSCGCRSVQARWAALYKACRQLAALLAVGGRAPLSLRPVVGIAGSVRQGCRAWRGGSLAVQSVAFAAARLRAVGSTAHARLGLEDEKLTMQSSRRRNRLLAQDRTQRPARLIAALDSARYKSRNELIQRFELSGRVSDLLASETDTCSSIGIRYTDAACFLQKKGCELQLEFFQHPLMDSESEAALFQLFAARGIGPSIKYLADNGRTRVLAFAVPPNGEVLADIVAEVCISVFRITLDDELIFGRGAI